MIINSVKQYIKDILELKASETNSLETQEKKIIELWTSMCDDISKKYFNCILNFDDPNDLTIDILNNAFLPKNRKHIIIRCFYNYVSKVEKKFSLDPNFVKAWKTAFDEIPEDEEPTHQTDYDLSNYISSAKTLMYKYILDSDVKDKNLKNKLILLKGWSSATPLINSYFSDNCCTGGGFYLNINGTGIVIDPGCNFITNMHKQGIRIFDIKYVIVTHDHIDHNDSIYALQDLNYEYNSFICNNIEGVLKNQKIPNQFPNIINWIVDSSTQKRIKENKDFSALLTFPDNSKKAINNIIELDYDVDTIEKDDNKAASKKFCNDATDISKIIENDIEISIFRTHHMPYSFGLKITAKINGETISIGYTSDTGYFDQLPRKFQGCQILIENISELAETDMEPLTVGKNSTHLKLNGCAKILKNNEKHPPRIAVISEFWGGKDDIRLFIVKKIKEKIKQTESFNGNNNNNYTKVLAGDVGLSISLEEMKIMCSCCNRNVSPKNLKTILPSKYGQLKYVCEKCLV